MAKNVLFITFFFPPIGSMGSIRLARLSRYLPEFGWQPRVLTVDRATAGRPYDDGLLEILPGDLDITRVDPLFDLGVLQRKAKRLHLAGVVHRLRNLLSHVPPDGGLGVAWIPTAYLQARRIVQREKPKAILTSSPPCMAHIVGLLLKKETGLPWVADFRDEWSQHPHRQFSFATSRRFDVWQERQVLCNADQIVTATEAYRMAFSSLLSASSASKAPNKFTTITHGFDPADFASNAGEHPPRFAHQDKFSLVHVGTLWGGIGFFTALERLLAKGDIPRDRIDVIIVGRIHPIWRLDGAMLVEKTQLLESVVRQVGWVAHQEAIQYLSHADVLLLVLDSHRGTETIPGKTYEYLASGRPILALVPPLSEVERLLAQTSRVTVVADGDVSAIAEAIMRLYDMWRDGRLERLAKAPLGEELLRYDGKTLTGVLARVLQAAL